MNTRQNKKNSFVKGIDHYKNNFSSSVESKAEFYWFRFLRSMIGPENSCYPLNQSDAEIKPIMMLSHASSRA